LEDITEAIKEKNLNKIAPPSLGSYYSGRK